MATVDLLISAEDVKCDICLESWIDRYPKVLICEHIFCRDCLQEKIKDNAITCQTCRKVTDVTTGLDKLPKCAIPKLCKSKISNPKCVIHQKPAVIPLFFCENCKAKDLCEDCFGCHNKPPCKIVPISSLTKLTELIEKERINQKQQEKKLVEVLEQQNKRCVSEINEKFEEINSQIKKLFETRRNDLSVLLKNDNYFMSEEDLKYRLKELCGREVKPNVRPNISVEYELHGEKIYDSMSSKKIDEVSLTFLKSVNIADICLFFTDDGFRYARNFNEKDQRLIFQTFDNISSREVSLQKSFGFTAFTENFFFGIALDDGCLYMSPIANVNELTHLQQELHTPTYDSILRTEEDLLKVSYILARNSIGELDFYMNGNYQWSTSAQDVRIACFLPRCNLLLCTKDKVKIIQKDNGNVLNEIKIQDEILGAWSCPKIGIILCQNVNEEKTLLLYDFDLENKKQLQCGPDLLQTTKTGLIYVRHDDNTAKVYKFE